MTAPVEALGPAATPDGARRRRSREMGNIARGGYGGRTAVDPGVAWKSLEPAEGPNKAKAGHDRTGDDAGDGPGKFKHPKTRSGRVSLPPRSPTPFPPPTPFPQSTPPPTPPPSVAGASLCCGSRIVDVRLLQDFISTRTCCRKCAEWHLAHQLTKFVNFADADSSDRCRSTSMGQAPGALGLHVTSRSLRATSEVSHSPALHLPGRRGALIVWSRSGCVEGLASKHFLA